MEDVSAYLPTTALWCSRPVIYKIAISVQSAASSTENPRNAKQIFPR